MTFRGQDITISIDEKMVTAVCDKTDRDEPILTKPINHENLKALADAVAVSRGAGALQKLKLAMEKLTGGAEEDALRKILSAVEKVAGALETVTSAKIDRLFVVSSCGRSCPCYSEVDIVVFVENLEAALENNLIESVSNSLRTVTSNTPNVTGLCFTCDVNGVRVCIPLTSALAPDAESQRKAVNQRLMTLDNQNALTDDETMKLAPSCAESQLVFYSKFKNSPHADFCWQSARLVKLWAARNLATDINPYVFEIIGLKAAEQVCQTGQTPELQQTLIAAFHCLSEPQKLHCAFDTFYQQVPQRVGGKNPVILDPVNAYNNLADTTPHWSRIQEAANSGLFAVKEGRAISEVFPPKALKSKGA